MKKSIFLLAMLLMAATAFTQTSRRSANSPTPAREEKEKSTTTPKREVTTRSSSSNTNSGTERRQVTTGQNNTATQGSTRSNSNTGTGRREVTVKQSENPAHKSPQNSSATVRRGSGNTDHHSENRNINNKANQKQVQHQNRSTNHTVVRSTPHGSNSGVRYESPRVYRETRVVQHHYKRPPRDSYYRSRHYPYREPARFEIYWTPSMRIEYSRYYPMVNHWRYTDGYRIPTISAYDAVFYHGEVMNVYGKVYEVFYTGKTDEYILYFGAYYPYHDFSVVLPGWIARRLSRWPERYFERQHVMTTGLVTVYDNIPEVVIRNTGQIRIY
ncbi:MAG: hypothetical protein R6W78_16055 [Bacteroidales bacterium]